MNLNLNKTLERLIRPSSIIPNEMLFNEDFIFGVLRDNEKTQVVNEGGFMYIPALGKSQYSTLLQLNQSGIYKLNNLKIVQLKFKQDDIEFLKENMNSLLRESPYGQCLDYFISLKDKKIDVLSKKVQSLAPSIYQSIVEKYPILDKQQREEVIRTRNRVICSAIL